MNYSDADFPNSSFDPFLVTSSQTTRYNCIAWACEDTEKWYWPDKKHMYYWPEEICRDETIECFIDLFKRIGYRICKNDRKEFWYTKVAIYCDDKKIPTHAARQLRNGYWTSKLGRNYDISHTLYSMSDGYYGNVEVFMKRRRFFTPKYFKKK